MQTTSLLKQKPEFAQIGKKDFEDLDTMDQMQDVEEEDSLNSS